MTAQVHKFTSPLWQHKFTSWQHNFTSLQHKFTTSQYKFRSWQQVHKFTTRIKRFTLNRTSSQLRMLHHMPSQSLRLLTAVGGGAAAACACFFFFGVFFLLLAVFFLGGSFLGVCFFCFCEAEVPSSSYLAASSYKTCISQFQLNEIYSKYTM